MGDGARVLARYFRQLKEAGEDEIYVSPDVAASIASGLSEPCVVATVSEPGGDSGRRGERSGPRSTVVETEVPPTAGAGSKAESVAAAAAGSAAAAGGARDAAGRRSTVSPEMAERLSELPEVEVVEVKLALGKGGATADMFTESTGLEGCRSLSDVEKMALGCKKCELAGGRTNVVFGAGNPDAMLMFVGEAPGANEDAEGVPFVGRAGQLLDKILAAAEIERDDVYIGNIIKCRPPNNRTPFTNEIEACVPYLAKQIEYIRPKVICTLGLPATQTLLGMKGSMRSLRGRIYRQGELTVIPTYHPAAALRDPKYKRPLWEDFLLIKRECSEIE